MLPRREADGVLDVDSLARLWLDGQRELEDTLLSELRHLSALALGGVTDAATEITQSRQRRQHAITNTLIHTLALTTHPAPGMDRFETALGRPAAPGPPTRFESGSIMVTLIFSSVLCGNGSSTTTCDQSEYGSPDRVVSQPPVKGPFMMIQIVNLDGHGLGVLDFNGLMEAQEVALLQQALHLLEAAQRLVRDANRRVAAQ